MTCIDSVLERVWPAFDLPGVRQHPQMFATYSGFPASNLTAVPADLDDEFLWLLREPIQSEHTIDLVEDPRPKLSIDEKIAMLLADHPCPLPASFRSFIRNAALHHRIRSCTACYLELPNFETPTGGVEQGRLAHFLSDQQWCLHWYLYVNESGDERVLCSPNGYGFYRASGDDAITSEGAPTDIAAMELAICADSFSEFIYRFWMENELWFSLTKGTALNQAQERYLQGYGLMAG